MPPPTTSDLIFSEQANHNFSKTLGHLKRHTLSIQNRLRSILEDAAFVKSVSAAYRRPLIANERCGSWYIDPKDKYDSAYFKSTDGHTGVWSFSTRRLNIHLLEPIGKHDGCIIVDSTRRGKRMPDALSKTIPIWCTVLNRALFPDVAQCHELYTPPHVVSSSEHAQIAVRVAEFLQSFLALDVDCTTLQAQIKKPLRPMWITPGSYISSEDSIFEDYHPIICCTASRRVSGGEISEGGYIQGSGDDTENWAFGLTPPIFWVNREHLLSTPEPELPEVISNLIASSSSSSFNHTSKLVSISPASTLRTTDLKTAAAQCANQQNLIISLHPETSLPTDVKPTTYHLHIPLGPHKLGSRNLRTVLPDIASFIIANLSQIEETSSLPTTATGDSKTGGAHSNNPSITIACSTRTDHSIGVALALLCLFYDASGQLHSPQKIRSSQQTQGAQQVPQGLEIKIGSGGSGIDKLFIRRRLGWIVSAMPDANPSSATLQSVNGFLMPRR